MGGDPLRRAVDTLEEIRRRRLSLGVSLGEMARAVGRSDATLSRIERGQIRPSYELVQRILSYLESREGLATPSLTARDVMRPAPTVVDAGASIAEAARLMERGGFSQLPVLEGNRVSGAVSEAAVLRALAEDGARRRKVGDVQEAAYPQVDPGFPADLLTVVLTRYPAVLVLERGRLIGIVTKTDLIRGLRGTPLRRPPSGREPADRFRTS